MDRVEPLLPVGRRGARRVDDRRVISGIILMLRSGARWRDCPPEYGPHTTIYNRFNRWSRQGIWLAMFKAVTGSVGVIGTASIQSTVRTSRRTARLLAEKGGLQRRRRTLARRTHDSDPRPHRRRRQAPGSADRAGQRP
jgi:transposase